VKVVVGVVELAIARTPAMLSNEAW